MNSTKLLTIIFFGMGLTTLHAAQHVFTQDERKYALQLLDEQMGEFVPIVVAQYANDHTEAEVKLFYEDLMGPGYEKIKEFMLNAAEKELGSEHDEINAPEEGKIVVCDSEEEDDEDIELPLSDTYIVNPNNVSSKTVQREEMSQSSSHPREEKKDDKPEQKGFFKWFRMKYETLSLPGKTAIGAGVIAVAITIVTLLKRK